MSVLLLMMIVLGQAPGAQAPAPAVPVDLQAVLPSQTGRSLPWAPKARRIKLGQVDPALRKRIERDLGPAGEVGPREMGGSDGGGSDVGGSNVGGLGPLIDPLSGRLRLGPGHLEPIRFVVCRIERDRPHRERLIIDANRDGRFDRRREVHDAKVEVVDGRPTVRHRSVRIEIVYEDAKVSHEFEMAMTHPKPGEAEAEDYLTITRRSWMEGTVELAGQRFRVALIDGNNDGRFTRHDHWIIVVEDKQADRAIGIREAGAYPRRLCRIGTQSYRLMSVTESASWAQVRRQGK